MIARESSARTWHRLMAISMAMAWGMVPGSGPAHAATPFPGEAAPEMRVATIGYRLAERNAGQCPRLAPLTGMLLHDRGAYAPAARDTVAAQFGLGEGIGILGVVAGAAADRAGLKPGDEVVALAGVPLANLRLPPTTAAASYARIEAFTALLAARLRDGPVTVTVRRGEALWAATVPLLLGCAAEVTVVPGIKPEAWSDARYAAVTQGLAQSAGDDELAFALAHEMAHVVLAHAEQRHGALVGLGIGGKGSRDRERAADRLGIAMVLGAGYDPAGAQALLDRFSRSSGPGFSLTHPTVRSRLRAIGEEVARIQGQIVGKPR